MLKYIFIIFIALIITLKLLAKNFDFNYNIDNDGNKSSYFLLYSVTNYK